MDDERGFIMLHVDINQYSPDLVKAVFGLTEEGVDENTIICFSLWLQPSCTNECPAKVNKPLAGNITMILEFYYGGKGEFDIFQRLTL